MWKESHTHIHQSIRVQVDTGYQGIQKVRANTDIPIKRRKKIPLTPEQKKHNHRVSSQRVVVEHVIRAVKIFKIVAERYRNRRRRFGLRMNLIAAIYNFLL